MSQQIGLTLKQVIERRKYLGGSDQSIIAGQNSYKDSFQLWEFKTGRYTPQESELSNKFTVAGHVFEDIILDIFKQKLKEDYDQEITYTSKKELVHPDYDFLVSHPDETLSNHDIIDCKTANAKTFFSKWGTEKHPHLPLEYAYQGMYNSGIYFDATGNKPSKFWVPVLKLTFKDYDIAEQLADKGELANYDNLIEYYLSEIEYKNCKQQAMNKYNKNLQKGKELDIPTLIKQYSHRKIYLKLRKKLEIRWFDFDLNTYEAMKANAIKWWNKHIVSDEEPIITHKSVKYLKEKYRYSTEGKEVNLGEELDIINNKLSSAKKRIWSLKKTLEESEEALEIKKEQEYINYLEMLILKQMQDAETANGKLISISAYNDTRHYFNALALQQKHPELYKTLVREGILKVTESERLLHFSKII